MIASQAAEDIEHKLIAESASVHGESTTAEVNEFEPSELEWAQVKHTLRAQRVIPHATAYMHCNLQRGVKSSSLRDAVASAVNNAKRIETDPTPMVHSLSMNKAASSQFVDLTADGYASQIAWTDTPVPVETFNDILAAADGSLQNIIQLSNLQLTRQQAKDAYEDRMEQAVESRKSKTAGMWTKFRGQCTDHGVKGIPAKQWPQPAAMPRDLSVQKDKKKGATSMGKALEDLSAEQQHGAKTWSLSMHALLWTFPWTENSTSKGKPALARSGTGKETVAFSRMINAAVVMLQVWEELQVVQYLEVSEATTATLHRLRAEREGLSNVESMQNGYQWMTAQHNTDIFQQRTHATQKHSCTISRSTAAQCISAAAPTLQNVATNSFATGTRGTQLLPTPHKIQRTCMTMNTCVARRRHARMGGGDVLLVEHLTSLLLPVAVASPLLSEIHPPQFGVTFLTGIFVADNVRRYSLTLQPGISRCLHASLKLGECDIGRDAASDRAACEPRARSGIGQYGWRHRAMHFPDSTLALGNPPFCNFVLHCRHTVLHSCSLAFAPHSCCDNLCKALRAQVKVSRNVPCKIQLSVTLAQLLSYSCPVAKCLAALEGNVHWKLEIDIAVGDVELTTTTLQSTFSTTPTFSGLRAKMFTNASNPGGNGAKTSNPGRGGMRGAKTGGRGRGGGRGGGGGGTAGSPGSGRRKATPLLQDRCASFHILKTAAIKADDARKKQ
eukprot:862336-Rhodomonas_salina.1